ncbi:MAG: 4Fe-4S binding protein [Candidatus Latescibacteria bacterium]|nr:4Fe-4S binding protein [bacterium]MBD3423016.1 4Fe-4S binding protein [Candidatus Latescibacterota bacterium]
MAKTRRIFQILFLILFLFLFMANEFEGISDSSLPLTLFLDLDPLLSISVILTSHSFQLKFLYGLITIALALLLGRVFCSWICPLGALNNFASYLKRSFSRTGNRLDRHKGLLSLKYYILFFILVAAILGWNGAGLIDPIPLLVRSLTIGTDPAFYNLVSSSLNSLISLEIPLVSGLSSSFLATLKGNILPHAYPLFRQSLIVGGIFLAILILNLVIPRFWCRYLCPLGALLGLAGSRQSLARIRINEKKCIECGMCNRVCQGEANPYPAIAERECIKCFNCHEVCPSGAIEIYNGKTSMAREDVDIERRWVLASAAGAVAAAAAVGAGVEIGRAHPKRIRPPGALPEPEFLEKCVKCGECMKVCLTNGLQPSLHQAGFAGMWTPILVPSIGYCEYQCNLCSQVCPTGAIRKLSMEEKQSIRIGLAWFDKDRCIPHATGINCGVCEEHCPAPGKAIKFEEEEVTGKYGFDYILKKPYIDQSLCIGCGICENKCVITDRPAVRVTSSNESRGDNQVFL